MNEDTHFKKNLIRLIALIICMLSVFIGCSNMIAEYGNSDDHIIRKNTVGATNSKTLRTLDFTPGNENSIFVSKTGNDSTGNGTATSPAATINHALTLCDATRQKVVILDSGTYRENGFEFTGNFRGLYAAPGEKPVIEFTGNHEFWTISEKIGETIYRNAATYSMASVELQDGDIFIAFQDYSDSSKGKYKVFDYTTGVETAGGTFRNVSTYSITAVMMNDGNIFIAFRDYSDSKGKYVVLDPDDWSLMERGTETEFIFHNDTTGFISSTVMSAGNIFIAYEDTGDNNWGKYLALEPYNWTEVRSGIFHSEKTNSISAEYLESGNVVIFFSDGNDSNRGKYSVFDTSTWDEVKAETLICDGSTGAVSSTFLSNGDILISYIDYGDFDKGKYIILDTDTWSIAKPETIFHIDPTANISPLMTSDGSIFIAYTDSGDLEHGKYVVFANTIDHIRVSVDAELNGIILTSRERSWLNSFISASNSKLTVKWCDIKGNYSSTSNQVCEAINTNSGLYVYNSRFYENDSGILAVSGNVKIADSHFYLNRKGYALTINGAAALPGDISIDHTDFFNNFGGIRLFNNDGNTEMVKNSIFHNNGNFGINADSSVSLSYSVITGSALNVTHGAGVVSENPNYVNCCSEVPDDLDLNIQVMETGFPADSPAKMLADDRRNAGAYDVEYSVK